MKFIITESQVYNMFFKRRIPRIKKLVTEKMMYYPPCDYNYSDDREVDWFDYYSDVRNGVIHEMISDLELGWDSDENIKKIDDLYEAMDAWMYQRFYDKVRSHFDEVLDKGCEE